MLRFPLCLPADRASTAPLRSVVVLSADPGWSAAVRAHLASVSCATGFSILYTDTPVRAAAYLKRLHPYIVGVDTDTVDPNALGIENGVLTLLADSSPSADEPDSDAVSRRRIHRSDVPATLSRLLRNLVD